MNLDKPNVIMIMADQFKATASRLYREKTCHTPHLKKLAEEGVLCRHAFTPHPLCVPARVSLFTGQYPHTHGARRNETLMPKGAVHAVQCWKEAGYVTGLIGKNHCFERKEDLDLFDVWCEVGHRGLPNENAAKGMDWCRPEAGINQAHETRRKMPDIHPAFSYAVTNYPKEDYATGLIAGQTLQFLEENQDNPFALWMSLPDPHTPIEAPAHYVSMIEEEGILFPPWSEEELEKMPERNRVYYEMMGIADASKDDIKKLMTVYYAMIRFIDDAVGQVVAKLEQLNLREKTMIVFCSDHGDLTGEHRMADKGGLFYDCLTRIPMIFSWPGNIPSGITEDSMVNLVDVVPTILKLQGLNIPASMQGKPLPVLSEEAPRTVTFAEYGAGGPAFRLKDLETFPEVHGTQAQMKSLQWREAEGRRKMVRTKAWKYVYDPMDEDDELYDMVNDPWELDNKAADPMFDKVKHEMRQKLLDWSIMTEDARPVPLP